MIKTGISKFDIYKGSLVYNGHNLQGFGVRTHPIKNIKWY